MNSDGVDCGALVWSDDPVLGIEEIDARRRERIALVQASIEGRVFSDIPV